MPPKPSSSPREPKQRAAVLALTLLAFGLRVWGTGYGLSLPIARPDEDRWVRVALGLLEDPDPRWFQWPTLHAYVLAGFYWLWGRFRLWRGDFPSWHAYLNEDQSIYLADHVLLGRLLSAVFGALAVPLAWKLGERLGPRGSGLLAALFMTVAYGPVRDAHWALIEAFLLLGILVSLLLTVRALEVPTLGRFVAAGVAAGLATSAKYSAVTLAAPIALAVLLARRREGRHWAGTLLDPRLLGAAGAMVLAFFAGSPFVLVSTREFMAALAIREWSYHDASFGTDVGFVHHLLFSMRHGYGVLMEVAGIAGMLLLGLHTPGRAIVAFYGLATYVALGPARIVPMRYASSLAPCIVLGASWAVFALAGRTRRPRPAILALAALLAAEPLRNGLRFDRLLGREDTRVAARTWLDLHVPPGTAVMARDSKALRWGRPILEDRYQVIAYGNRLARRREARYVLLSESPTGYVPWAPEIHELLGSLGSVVARFDPYAPGAEPVYDPHDAFFVPVAGFAGVRSPGPRITIYDIAPR